MIVAAQNPEICSSFNTIQNEQKWNVSVDLFSLVLLHCGSLLAEDFLTCV